MVTLRLQPTSHVGGMPVDRLLHCLVEVGIVTAAPLVVVDNHHSDPDTTFQDRNIEQK